MYLAISLAIVLIIISMLLTNWNLINCKKIAKIWEEMAFTALEEANKEREQAESFEQAAKTMEEHLSAERGRADRLAEALRMSEDARCELKQQLEKAQETIREQSSGEKQLHREMLNLFRYDGTEQSQEDLTDE